MSRPFTRSRLKKLKDTDWCRMTREIPKNAVALVITKEPGEGEDDFMLDLQVLAPETGDEDNYLVSIANLAANLLENSMFGDEEDEDEESFELDPDFLGSIDLGED